MPIAHIRIWWRFFQANIPKILKGIAKIVGYLFLNERQNRTWNICDKNEIGDEFHYVLQCPSLHDDRRRLLDSTYLTPTNIIKAKLYMNVHCMVLYKLYVFCSDMKFKMAATAGLSLTLDPMGKMFQNASSLKPLR